MITVENHLGDTIPFSTLGFSGGERHVQLKLSDIPEIDNVINIRARISSSDQLMDVLLLQDALLQEFGEYITYNLELPYLPYSRQDRVCSPGQSFALKVFSDMLRFPHSRKIATWDCHSYAGIIHTNAINVKPADIISKSDELCDILKGPKLALVCPDKGAVDRTHSISKYFGGLPVVYCEKVRDPATGTLSGAKVLNSEILNLEGTTLVITDDICDGGWTFINLAQELRKMKPAKIILYVTHGIFSKGIDVFSGLIDEIYTSTSFPAPSIINCGVDKFTQIDYKYQF